MHGKHSCLSSIHVPLLFSSHSCVTISEKKQCIFGICCSNAPPSEGGNSHMLWETGEEGRKEGGRVGWKAVEVSNFDA